MIKEDYVSFEVAKLLKEKGFNEACEYCYVYFSDDDIRVIHLSPEKYAQLLRQNNYPYITQQMAQKWLREVHKTFIQIDYDYYENDGFYYGYSIVKINTLDDNGEVLTEIGGKMFETYEKACEEAIAYCLTNLVQTLHPDMSYDELCEHYEKENEY